MDENARFAIARAVTLQVIAYIMLLSLPASARDPHRNLLGCPVPDCIGKWCRDDYCPKQEPCVDVSLCFGCDDYRGKKAPCVCAPLSVRCDDYCKKCPPKVCRGPLGQYLRCGTSCQPRGCDNCQPLPCDGFVGNPVELQQPLTQQPLIADGEDQRVAEPLPAQPKRFAPVIVRPLNVKLE
jgi:hypothetical protein